jgi:hypothetical protein
MNPRHFLGYSIAALAVAGAAQAQAPVHNPTSKIYVADVEGLTKITTAKGISVLAKKEVYKGEGTVFETEATSNAAIVLSNGTGTYIDVSTRTDVLGFVQAPFRPNRSDMDEEPSISRTHFLVNYGVVGISTSRMAAGSTLLIDTPLASAAIEGRQAVFQVSDSVTIISMFLGDATVQAGPRSPAYQVKGGQQIIVRPGKPGQPNTVEIRDVPEGAMEGQRVWLYERVLTADAARKLVYFEMQSGSDDSITLFDGNSPGQQIVAVPVVPAVPPVSPTVSAANLSGR